MKYHRSLTIILISLNLASCKNKQASLESSSQVAADEVGRTVIGQATDVANLSVFPDKTIDILLDSERIRDWAYRYLSKVTAKVTVQNELTIPVWLTYYEKPEIESMVAAYLRSSLNLPKGSYGFSDDQIDAMLSKATTYDGGHINIKELAKSTTGGGFSQNTIGSENKGGIFLNQVYVRHILQHYKNIAKVEGFTRFRNQKNVITNSHSETFTMTSPFVEKMPPFPLKAAAVKVLWQEEGMLKTYDTDAASIADMASNHRTSWQAAATTVDTRKLSDSEIFRIKTRDGKTFVAPAIHFIVKNSRPWMWVTLWWHPNPDQDFGSDRPSSVIGAPWNHYKMSAIAEFTGEDAPRTSTNIFSAGASEVISARPFPEYRSLMLMMKARFKTADIPSWTSNPYLENQHFLATNCMTCHAGIDLNHPLIPGMSYAHANSSLSGAPDPAITEDFSFQASPIALAIHELVTKFKDSPDYGRCNIQATATRGDIMCPQGYTTNYNDGVHVAATCVPGGKCERCIGFSEVGAEPGYDRWPHDIDHYSDVRVTDGLPVNQLCGGNDPPGCNVHNTHSLGRVLCPTGYGTRFTFAVNADAQCNPNTRLCNYCIGYQDPTYGSGTAKRPWPQNKSDRRYQGGIRVVEPLLQNEVPKACQGIAKEPAQ